MKKHGFIVFLCVFLASWTGTIWGQTPTPTSQGCLFGAEGYVTTSTGQPIAGARVTADTAATTTDVNGYYSISHIQLNCNALHLYVSANGYGSASQSTGSTPGIYTINFTLIPIVSDPPFVDMPGDVNKDRAVNIIDAMLVAQYSAGMSVTGFDILAADVNGTTNVDITDALIIARYSAGQVANLLFIWPRSGPIGTQVTIQGIGFDFTDNEVRFIDPTTSMLYYLSELVPSSDGSRLTFSVPAIVNPYCYYQIPRCASPSLDVQPGTYHIMVITGTGESYAVPFTVTAS